MQQLGYEDCNMLNADLPGIGSEPIPVSTRKLFFTVLSRRMFDGLVSPTVSRASNPGLQKKFEVRGSQPH